MQKLYEWLNKEYLQNKNVIQIRNIYKNNTELHQIQLQNFFNNNKKQLIKEILQLKTTIKYAPNIYSYQFVEKIKNDSKFKHVISFLQLLDSDEWKKYISFITQKELRNPTLKIKLFYHKDYTVIHDSVQQKKSINVIIDLTDNWNEKYGGFIGLHKDDTFLIVPPLYNSILIFKKDTDVRTFVKYINHHAKKKKRILIEVEYEY